MKRKYAKTFGSKKFKAHPLKTFRVEQGITQLDLAEKAGISHTYMNLIENGKAPLSAVSADKIKNGYKKLGYKIPDKMFSLQSF